MGESVDDKSLCLEVRSVSGGGGEREEDGHE